ncbi:MAG: hypothetical protein A2Y73_01600 [Chloroflexi bacterium RBG_13_56_8]|nr:MAG: hypothetical protein A2Y73_01600 [Chloroflexi bacterium RBG_13_56_8]
MQNNPLRLAVLLAGAGLSLCVSLASGSRAPDRPYWDLLFLWGLSIALALAAFVDWRGLPRRLQQAGAAALRMGPEAAFVLLIALATLALRAVHLDSIPYVLSGDEASLGLEAISVIEGQRNSPFVTGWLSHPSLYFFIQAAFLRVFGISVSALRLPSALISSATVVFLYLFARHAYGRRVAVLAAVFFAAYHYAIHYGRLGLNNIWDPFFALGVIYFVQRGLTGKRLGSWLAAGVLMGLAAYFYMGARLIPLLLVPYLAYRAFREQGFWQEHASHLVVFVLTAFVVALPILAFFARHPQDLMARWSWLGIFPSGWVEAEIQRTGKGVLSIVFDQFLKSALAFNYFPDTTFHYHAGVPLLDFFTSILFVFGIAYAIWHWRKPEYLLLSLWYLSVVIFGGTLLENPPASARLVMAIPPVVLCVALSMDKISTYVASLVSNVRHMATAISLVLLAVACYGSLHFYFAEYAPSSQFSDLNTEVADQMGKYLRALGPEYRCYFFGAPRMYYGHATIPFLARGVEGLDIIEPIPEDVDFVDSEHKAVFVFLPERSAELNTVRRYYPEGQLREFRSREDQLLFLGYESDG